MSSPFRRARAVRFVQHGPVLVAAAALAALLVTATHAQAGQKSWAARQIRAVTQAGVLGTSPATFHASAPLTQSELENAIATTAKLQTPPPAPPTPPPAAPTIEIDSSIGNGAVVAGVVAWEIDVPNQSVAQVDFAVDGTGLASATTAPFLFEGTTGLDTTKLSDGVHTLAVKATFTAGGSAIAVWQFTVANAPGAELTGPGAPTPVPVVKQSVPAAPTTTTPTPTPATPAPVRRLYHAVQPAQPVTIKQLDAALVGYLALGSAARQIQSKLSAAGLNPPANTGTEVVARLLRLRLNHPASQDNLELLPFQAATRAEAAWSFAQTLAIGSEEVAEVQQAAESLTIPALTPWQRRILTTAVHYVGYPYVWGGTSPTSEVDFGVPAAGGFDCSGFVWRVYKLTSYPSEGSLADTLRGRTTYVMSGEVPASERIGEEHLQPADVMFFGANGPQSTPAQVDHTALYLGGGWLIQSSDEGVTLAPLDGWNAENFAWARRPLREAGLE
jgi:cell wall-associated NlpC family hydrolase